MESTTGPGHDLPVQQADVEQAGVPDVATPRTTQVPAPRRSPAPTSAPATGSRPGWFTRRPLAPRPPWQGHFTPWWPALLVAVDVLAVAGAAVVVEEVSRRVLTMGALTIALFAVGGLYRNRLTPSVLDDVAGLVGRALIAGAVVTGLGAFLDGWAGRATLLAAGAMAALATLGRAVVYAFLRAARRRGRVNHRTLVLGGGELAGQLATTFLEHPETGLLPVGFLDDDPLLPAERRPVPHLGRSSDLVDVIIDQRIDEVVVAYASIREAQLVDLLRACDRLACEILLVPRLYELSPTTRDMETVWGTPLVRIRRAPFRTQMWRLKRVLDVAASAAALVVLAPLLAAVALAVRVGIGSPVLFRQERVGLDGRCFVLLKFCSLRPAGQTESAQRWNISHDDRLTPVGRFIRRTSLDELPQLWNVLRGDMSLVGPRPERPYFVEEFARRFPLYMARHRVPAGLTGAAQVAGLRGDTSIMDRARFDNYYVENWSLWNDCKLLLRTAGQVVRGAGG
jgi:exopolysaccharide biosynthesis polyprenyl glycosylphosphotransferase